MDVKIKCRKCGREAPSKEFVLDNDYKMVVCKICVNEKNAKRNQPEKQNEKEKPPGWDAEDMELIQLQKARKQQQRMDFKVTDMGNHLKMIFARMDVHSQSELLAKLRRH